MPHLNDIYAEEGYTNHQGLLIVATLFKLNLKHYI